MDWLDLLAVQGTLKSLLQPHSWKASILQCSAFFAVQLSHPYMTTGKIIAVTRRTFVGKVMSLLFNMLSSMQRTLVTVTCHSNRQIAPHVWRTCFACLPFALSMSPPLGFAGGATGKEPTGQWRRCKRWLWSLSLEDLLEEGTATHSSILAWKTPWTEVGYIPQGHKESETTSN